eukprot:240993-Amphidinium_carterae.1
MVRLHISEADLAALRCPQPQCREAYSYSDLCYILGSDAAEISRWNELALQLCIDTMQDVSYCPRCDLDSGDKRVPCILEEGNMARCSECLYVFCGRCKAPYHPGVKTTPLTTLITLPES